MSVREWLKRRSRIRKARRLRSIIRDFRKQTNIGRLKHLVMRLPGVVSMTFEDERRYYCKVRLGTGHEFSGSGDTAYHALLSVLIELIWHYNREGF